MNSLMSMRTIAWSSSNRNSAIALVSSVLPTPVGPRNRNEPIGRFGSCRPARARRTALATATIASSWPITRLWICSSMRKSLPRSPSSILSTGTPVQRDTTAAMSSGMTSSLTPLPPTTSWPSASLSLRSRSGITPYASSPALPSSPLRWAISSSERALSSCSLIFCESASLSLADFHEAVRAADFCSSPLSSFSSFCSRSLDAVSDSFFNASRSILSRMMRRSSSSSSSGLLSTCMRMRLAASSIKSMALSGRKRSEM